MARIATVCQDSGAMRGLPLAFLLGSVAVAAGLGGWALRGLLPLGPADETRASSPVRAFLEPAPDTTPAPLPPHIDALLVGGGPYPGANEVQLENDLGLAAETLEGHTLVTLYAGGPGTRAVRIVDGSAPVEPVIDTLVALFGGATARGSTYRPTRLRPHGAATLETTLELLALARADEGAGPLLFFFAGHGDGGDAPDLSSALFWGGEALDPVTLATELDLAPSGRRTRVVMTSCYSGGFADLVFQGADPHAGPTSDDRCGFFSTAWDREASGCDPDPDRGAHEGYGLHVLAALRGEDRDGIERRSEIDLDGDGTITLAEAHARARVVSRSIDVPTATSARLVRELSRALPELDAPAIAWREEEYVRAELGEALDLRDATEAERRASEVEVRQAELEARRDALEEEEDAAWIAVTSALLSRWPILDDPWHADFDRTVETEGPAILEMLATLPAYAAWTEASDAMGDLGVDAASLEVEGALLARFLEADQTLRLAARLASAAPEAWASVMRVRACEETAP